MESLTMLCSMIHARKGSSPEKEWKGMKRCQGLRSQDSILSLTAGQLHRRSATSVMSISCGGRRSWARDGGDGVEGKRELDLDQLQPRPLYPLSRNLGWALPLLFIFDPLPLPSSLGWTLEGRQFALAATNRSLSLFLILHPHTSLSH